MKIALVTCAIKFGGIETFLKRLATFLLGQGHDVQLVETDEHGEWADEFKASGLSVLNLLGYPIRSRRCHALRIARALQQFDVVILNDTPFAQAVLGLLPESTASFPIVHLDMPSFYTNATGSRGEWDAVVSVGPRITRTLAEQHSVPLKMIREIPYGVEVPEAWPKSVMPRSPGGTNTCGSAGGVAPPKTPRTAGRANPPGEPPPPVTERITKGNLNCSVCAPLKIAYVGRLEDRQKGVLRLPAILKQAAKQIAISFEIIGDGPDHKNLRAALHRSCPELQVKFHGLLSKDQTRSVLGKRDVLLLPSNFEGYPIVVLEAMAEGVVPIVSRLPGVTDQQIEDGRNGFLVEPGNTDGFAAALVQLGLDREKLSTMSQAAWSEARKRFTVEEMCQKYLALIHELHTARMKISSPRSGNIAIELLGDLPNLPLCLVRPLRKGMRTLGLWPSTQEQEIAQPQMDADGHR